MIHQNAATSNNPKAHKRDSKKLHLQGFHGRQYHYYDGPEIGIHGAFVLKWFLV